MKYEAVIGLLVGAVVGMSTAIMWLAKELIKANKARVDDAEKRMEQMEKTKKEVLTASNKMIAATLKALDKHKNGNGGGVNFELFIQ